jgi:hypothetical protein
MVSKLTIEYFGPGLYHRVVDEKGPGSHRALMPAPWTDLNAAMASPRGIFYANKSPGLFCLILRDCIVSRCA